MKRGRLREDVIRVKIAEIHECVDLVRDNLPKTYDAFSRLGIIKDGIYKRMEFAIEDVFDICAVINTDRVLGIPGADEEILNNLVVAGILSPGIIDTVRRMRGFRNIVVHRYGKIDDRLAFDLLNEELGDFDQFIGEIEKFLSGHD